MKKGVSLISISVVLICVWSSFLMAAGAGIAERVRETTLGNGLKVILLENQKAPLVTVQIWYRVGSRNEAWGKTGLSHMLEHMMFKGTAKYGPEQFTRIIQENGGNDNAFTSTDYTAYFTNISADRINVPLELEADRLANLILREEDFRTERMVVMEERRLRTDDNPQANLIEALEATAFQVQPYHWPIIGWMADIESYTLEDLKNHFTTYYNPSNAILVVAGAFRHNELIALIEKHFGTIKKGVAPSQERPVEQPQIGERRVIVKKEAMAPCLLMGYHVPNMKHPDSYVLDVIASLLSQGKSSRLHKGLVRERQLTLSAEADYPFLSRDPSLFYLSAEPLPGKDVREVEKALDEEMLRLQKEPVAPRELEKIKNQIEASFIYAQDSLFHQAMTLARYEIAGGWRKVDDYLPGIRKVTAEDIMCVAGRYLIPDNRTVGILVPLPPGETKAGTGPLPIREGVKR